MIDPEVVARLRKSRDWMAVQDHIEGIVAELDRLPHTKGKDDRTIATETVGREWARDKLAEVLRPFIDYEERPDTLGLAQERAEDAGLD